MCWSALINSFFLADILHGSSLQEEKNLPVADCECGAGEKKDAPPAARPTAALNSTALNTHISNTAESNLNLGTVVYCVNQRQCQCGVRGACLTVGAGLPLVSSSQVGAGRGQQGGLHICQVRQQQRPAPPRPAPSGHGLPGLLLLPRQVTSTLLTSCYNTSLQPLQPQIQETIELNTLYSGLPSGDAMYRRRARGGAR